MFILGGYLDFHIPPLIALFVPVIFFISMLFLPETPHFYLSKNENEKALKSLMFYRNCGEKNDSILEELETFRNSVQNVEKEKVGVKDFREFFVNFLKF
jgi:SP family facilitated glucose transporter-like MFS transporter 8